MLILRPDWQEILLRIVWKEKRPKEILFEANPICEEIQKNIVYNSIIDAGDNSAAFQTSDFSERAPKNEVLSLPNMKERKLQITEGNGTRFAVEGSNIDDNNCNIYTINGYIHQVHKVIDPSEQTVTDIFQKMISKI